MKRKVIISIFILLLVSMSMGFTKTLSGVVSDLQLFVNGQEVDKEILLVEGASYLPVRAIGEALNSEVLYNGTKRTININSKESTIYSEEELDQVIIDKKNEIVDLEKEIEGLNKIIEETGKPLEFSAGFFYAGEDFPIGRYKIYDGSSNFFVKNPNSGYHRNVNIILDDGTSPYDIGVTEYVYNFKEGDEIKANSKFKMVPIQ